MRDKNENENDIETGKSRTEYISGKGILERECCIRNYFVIRSVEPVVSIRRVEKRLDLKDVRNTHA